MVVLAATASVSRQMLPLQETPGTLPDVTTAVVLECLTKPAGGACVRGAKDPALNLQTRLKPATHSVIPSEAEESPGAKRRRRPLRFVPHFGRRIAERFLGFARNDGGEGGAYSC